jgi:hypothetical protein
VFRTLSGRCPRRYRLTVRLSRGIQFERKQASETDAVSSHRKRRNDSSGTLWSSKENVSTSNRGEIIELNNLKKHFFMKFCSSNLSRVGHPRSSAYELRLFRPRNSRELSKGALFVRGIMSRSALRRHQLAQTIRDECLLLGLTAIKNCPHEYGVATTEVEPINFLCNNDNLEYKWMPERAIEK